jgi:hypothetical protein
MPLLNRPNPIIPQRQYRVRIEEPLAVMMERYAEFLGATNVDHVIGEALAFVFKKDTEFKDWLSRHPAPAIVAQTETRKPKPNGTGGAVMADAGKGSAVSGATI